MPFPRGLSPRLRAVLALLAADTHELDLRCFEAEPGLCTFLCGHGLGALAYHRLRRQLGTDHAVTQRFYEVYCLHAVLAQALRQSTVSVARALDAAGIPHVFFKGVCIGRWYEDPALRPFGDVDVIVAERDFARACTLLAERHAGPRFRADVQHTVVHYGLPTFEVIHARGSPMALTDDAVRTLDSTDTLIAACLHLAKHACERPIWLHDLTRIVRAPEAALFDFVRLSGLPPWRAAWLASVLAVTERLLGPCLPAELRVWSQHRATGTAALAATFLSRWERPPRTRSTTAGALSRQPRDWWDALRERWPLASTVRFYADLPPHRPVMLRQLVLFVSIAARAAPRIVRGLPAAQDTPSSA